MLYSRIVCRKVALCHNGMGESRTRSLFPCSGLCSAATVALLEHVCVPNYSVCGCPKAHLAVDVQKQIAESKKQKAKADEALAASTQAVAELQRRLSAAQEDAARLQKQANSIKRQADSEVSDLKLLEQKVFPNTSPLCSILQAVLQSLFYCCPVIHAPIHVSLSLEGTMRQ